MTLPPVLPAVLSSLGRTRPVPTGDMALGAGLHAHRLVLLKSLLARVDRERDSGADGPWDRFDGHWSVLEQAERAAPGAVGRAIDYPMTGAWLVTALGTSPGPAFARSLGHFGSLAVAAALRSGGRATVHIDAPQGSVHLPGLGTLYCAAGPVDLHVDRGGLRWEAGAGAAGFGLSADGRPSPDDVRDFTGLDRLPGSAVVLDDLDPYRTPCSATGPAQVHAASRAFVRQQPWFTRWRQGRELLAKTDPPRIAEAEALLRAVVPLRPVDGHAHGPPTSATLRSAPGAVFTELPAGPEEMAEVLVHEAHHTKLAALNELVPLCGPSRGAVHRVGWRADLRPIGSVLQGAYAHLALTDLWRRAGTGDATPRPWRRRAAQQFEMHREQVRNALSILLESDELTFEGREFAREMGRHHASLGRSRPLCA